MRYIFPLLIMFTSCGEEEQTFKPSITNPSVNNNPVIKSMFTADPAVLVYEDVFYLYTGHDEQTAQGNGFLMNNWQVFSSTDMVNWKSYGAGLNATDFSWASGQAWAAHVVEKNDKFYWYVTVEHATIAGKAVGVAVADKPEGPYIDAIGSALIHNNMTTHADNTGKHYWDDIDPAVFIDDNGKAYIYWGNTVCKWAKLKDNMIELDGEIHTIDLPQFTEAPWVHKKDDKYYLSYAAGYPERIDYAMADSPEGPWIPMGLLNDVIENSPTNHQAITSYKDNWYFIYHNAALTGGGEFRRSVCIDYLYYNFDGSLKKVVQTAKGVSEIK